MLLSGERGREWVIGCRRRENGIRVKQGGCAKICKGVSQMAESLVKMGMVILKGLQIDGDRGSC